MPVADWLVERRLTGLGRARLGALCQWKKQHKHNVCRQQRLSCKRAFCLSAWAGHDDVTAQCGSQTN